MKLKKQISWLFLLFIFLFIFGNKIIIEESKATTYDFPFKPNFQGTIYPNDPTSINLRFSNSIDILSDIEVNLNVDFHFVVSRQLSIIVNNTEPINLTLEWYLDREAIKQALLVDLPNIPTLRDLLLLFSYNCYFRITSNTTISSLTLKFDKILNFGLDPSKQYILASYVSGNSEWNLLPTAESINESTSETYLETTLTDVTGSNSYYFTIYEKDVEEPFPLYLTIIMITIPVVMLVALIIIISKQDYIQILKNRNNLHGSDRHRLSLEEVLENENRNMIIGFILKSPGIHFNELLRETKMAPGTLVWHLDILLSYKIIGKKRFENFLVYFPYYTENPLSNLDLKIQKSKLTLKLLKLIEKEPGIYISQISKKLHLNRKTLQYNVDKLVELDILVKEKKGRKNLLYLKTNNSVI